ncbi:protein hairless [Ischnura elegans]|uniref:protein hairless n=1 Tax=Ischnura elegans TaxID=197161 RepID=UPI001ED892F3|nr:protein hairless [Ischnura elegans]
MRVQDSSTSASCAKMTEEMSKNGGPEVNTGRKKGFGPSNANGSQSPSISVSNDTESCKTVSGGRLKFYKDGKFILELSHRKDGERTSWVPVPKKTCWPPLSSASSTTMAVPGSTPRQESSASLSVSDDNSSVQSSPWQRDHGWKQGTPRHGISKEMSFIMKPLKRSGQLKKLRRSHPVRKRRRRPHSPSDVKPQDVSDPVCVTSKVGPRPKLLDLVESLWKKSGGLSDGVARTSGGSVTHNHVVKSEGSGVVTGGKLDPSLVSPRKRILREMERVSLEDHATSKRHKSRSSALVECRKPPVNASNSTCQMQRLKPVDKVPSPPPIKGVERLSNYSISSLLGKASERGNNGGGGGEGEPSPVLRSLLRSPTRGGSNSQDCHSPSPISEAPPQGLSAGRGGGKVPSPRHRHASPPAVPYHHPQHSLAHHHHQVPLHSPRLPSPPSLPPSSPPHSRGLSRPSVASLSSSSSPSSSPSSHIPFLAPPALFPGGGLFPTSSALAPPAYLPPHASSLAHPYYSAAAGLPSGMRQPYRSTPSPVPSLWLHNYGMPSLPVARTGDAIGSRSLYPGVMVGPCHSPMGVMPHWQSLVPHLQEDYKKDDGNSDAPLNLSKNAG